MAYNNILNGSIQNREQVQQNLLDYTSLFVPYWASRGNVYITEYFNDQITIVSQDTVSSSKQDFLDSVSSNESMMKRSTTDFLTFKTKMNSESICVITDKRLNIFNRNNLSKLDSMINMSESNNQVSVEMIKSLDKGLLLGYGSMSENYYGIATNNKANNTNVGALGTNSIIDTLLTAIQDSVLSIKSQNSVSDNDILVIIGKDVYKKLSSTFVGTSSVTTLYQFLTTQLLQSGINILVNDQNYGQNMVNVINLKDTYAYLSTLPRLDITAERPQGFMTDQHDNDAIKYHFLFSPINFRAKNNHCVYNYNNISFS